MARNKQDSAERVIFRTEHDTENGRDDFLAVFPDDKTSSPGRLGYIAFYFTQDGGAMFESYGELSAGYYYRNTRLVHKNTETAQKCLDALRRRYGSDYRIVEKITTRR